MRRPQTPLKDKNAPAVPPKCRSPTEFLLDIAAQEDDFLAGGSLVDDIREEEVASPKRSWTEPGKRNSSIRKPQKRIRSPSLPTSPGELQVYAALYEF